MGYPELNSGLEWQWREGAIKNLLGQLMELNMNCKLDKSTVSAVYCLSLIMKRKSWFLRNTHFSTLGIKGNDVSPKFTQMV